MGRKKKFIDKKKSVTYELVHRDQKDPLIADSNLPSLILNPVKAYGRPVDDEMYQMLLERIQPELARKPDEEQEEPDSEGPETEADDFSEDSGDEEFIFKRFTRPMGTQGGVFITPKGEILSSAPSVNVQNIPANLLPSMEEEEVGMLSKGLDDVIDEEIEEALEYYSEGEYEELADDFVDSLVQIDKEMASQGIEGDSVDDDYGDLDDIEDDTPSIAKKPFQFKPSQLEKPRELTDLDRAFDKALEEFDEDESVDEDEDGPAPNAVGFEDIKSYDSVLDQFLNDNNKILYKHDSAMCHVWEPKRNIELPERITRIPKAEKVLLFGQEEEESYDDEKEDTQLEEIRLFTKEAQWDCESICTTYTNTENHPSLIAEPKKEMKIALSKDGVPLFYQPKRIREEEEQEEELPKENLGVARPKDEAPEVKRARKQASKEQKRLARERKKALRVEFKDEEIKQRNENVNNMKGTTVVQYGVR